MIRLLIARAIYWSVFLVVILYAISNGARYPEG